MTTVNSDKGVSKSSLIQKDLSHKSLQQLGKQRKVKLSKQNVNHSSLEQQHKRHSKN